MQPRRSVTTARPATAEGLTLQAFREEHALQCGYCTPGFMMSTVSLLASNPSPTTDEIGVGLEGNICRCTGYVNIEKAVLAAAATYQTGR